MKISQVLLIGGLLTACTSKGPDSTQTPATEVKPAPIETLPKSLSEALSSNFRNPENRRRDIYRHPLETLQFFGIKPESTVVEITPGGGWYTEILAPFLQGKGQYIAAVVPAEKSAYAKSSFDKLDGWFKSHPVLVAKYGTFSPADSSAIVPAGSADLVLTFRNIHNWMSNGSDAKAFAAFYAALKPGGVLGVVEHRASEKGRLDPKGETGYVKESYVIKLATAAGFKLEAKSEINANPKDTKDHPEGVWTLPPTLALKDKDREKYLAIGESDRMTLRFVKPKK